MQAKNRLAAFAVDVRAIDAALGSQSLDEALDALVPLVRYAGQQKRQFKLERLFHCKLVRRAIVSNPRRQVSADGYCRGLDRSSKRNASADFAERYVEAPEA